MLYFAFLLAPIAATSAAEDPFTWLINLGVAGIVIVLLITGKLRTGKEVEYLLEEMAAKDELIKAFQTQLMGQTLPALTRSTQVLEAIPTSEKSMYEALNKSQQEVLGLTKRLHDLLQEEGGSK